MAEEVEHGLWRGWHDPGGRHVIVGERGGDVVVCGHASMLSRRRAVSRGSAQVTTMVAASAMRWSFDHGGPNVARGPWSTSSARSPRMRGRRVLDVLGVVEVDVPAAVACQLGEHLAVHDGVGSALVRHTTLDGDVRRGSRRARLGATSRRSVPAPRPRARPVPPTSPGPPTLARPPPAPRARRRRVAPRPVEQVWAALVVDRRRRQARFDQLDPPAVDDLVIRRGRDGHGPAEVMGDAETHADPDPRTPGSSGHQQSRVTNRGRRDVPLDRRTPGSLRRRPGPTISARTHPAPSPLGPRT